jgi:hypothetical protein
MPRFIVTIRKRRQHRAAIAPQGGFIISKNRYLYYAVLRSLDGEAVFHALPKRSVGGAKKCIAKLGLDVTWIDTPDLYESYVWAYVNFKRRGEKNGNGI